MLSGDEVADVEGDAAVFLSLFGFSDGDAPSVGELCERATGRRPRAVPGLGVEARLEPTIDGEPEVLVSAELAATQAARARFKAAHELGHLFYESVRPYRGTDVELRCDAFAAAIVAPRRAFQLAIRKCGGHRVHALAKCFATTQSTALLRIGEVTGRPVALQRFTGVTTRGEPYGWPKASLLVSALREGRSAVHPVRLTDEGDRWGFMVRREV